MSNTATLPPVYLQVNTSTPKWLPRTPTETYLNAGASREVLDTLQVPKPLIAPTFFWQAVWCAAASAAGFIAAAVGAKDMVAIAFIFLTIAIIQLLLHTGTVRQNREHLKLWDEVRGLCFDRAGDTLVRLADVPRSRRGWVTAMADKLNAARALAQAKHVGPGPVPGEQEFQAALVALGPYARALSGHGTGGYGEGPIAAGAAAAAVADAVNALADHAPADGTRK